MRPELEEALLTALAVASHRRTCREALRAALKAGDTAEVVRLAGQLLGFEDEAQGHRSSEGVERGAGGR